MENGTGLTDTVPRPDDGSSSLSAGGDSSPLLSPSKPTKFNFSYDLDLVLRKIFIHLQYLEKLEVLIVKGGS